MNKKALELSINFIVILIISIVIFVFGINYLYNILNMTIDLKDMTESQIDKQISQLMCGSTEKACLNTDTLLLSPKELEIVTVKVLNINNPSEEFFISVDNGTYIDSDNNAIKSGDANYENNIFVKPRQDIINIEENEEHSFGIGFQLPKDHVAAGTYIFDLKIYKGNAPVAGNEYDRPHKIYVKVK